MANILSTLGQALSGFGAGIQSPTFAIQQLAQQRQREAQQRQREGEIQAQTALNRILSGQTVPAFAREELTPAQIRQSQLAQLASIDSPVASRILQQEFQSQNQLQTMGLRSQLERIAARIKNENPDISDVESIRRAGQLIKSSQGFTFDPATGQTALVPGFAQAEEQRRAARERGTQEVRREFEPGTAAETARQTVIGRARGQREANFPQAVAAFETNTQKTRDVLSDIDAALPNVNSATAGFASLIDFIPGTPQADLAAQLQTIRANLGFQELEEMRANSPTGGALGQVTEREIAFLQSTIANIENAQSPEQLRSELNKLKNRLRTRQKRLEAAFQRDARLAQETAPAGEMPQVVSQDQIGGEVILLDENFNVIE